MHVLTSRSRPHPRGYTVEFVSVRKGSPRDNLTRVAVVYSKEGRVPCLEYKTIAVGKMKKWVCLSSHHLTQGRHGLSLTTLVSDPAASRPPAEREDVHRLSVRWR